MTAIRPEMMSLEAAREGLCLVFTRISRRVIAMPRFTPFPVHDNSLGAYMQN